MKRLFPLILIISVGSCAGAAVIAALTMGYYTASAIMISGGLGAAVGVPVGWYVAGLIHKREVDHHPENPEGLRPDNPHGEVRRPPK